MSSAPVALITGAARRLGAAQAVALHRAGYRVIIHYHRSASQARALCQQLNNQVPESAHLLCADLCQPQAIPALAEAAWRRWQRLDTLINNASAFFPTVIGHTNTVQWDQLMGSNAQTPFFLSQALAAALRETQGSIVNLIDIHANRPLRQHPVYCMAKSALAALTRSLALELAPQVRVNGIAPGAILLPETGLTGSTASPEMTRSEFMRKIPLGRLGTPDDITQALLFLLSANYVTGQVIVVDGGRSIGD